MWGQPDSQVLLMLPVQPTASPFPWTPNMVSPPCLHTVWRLMSKTDRKPKGINPYFTFDSHWLYPVPCTRLLWRLNAMCRRLRFTLPRLLMTSRHFAHGSASPATRRNPSTLPEESEANGSSFDTTYMYSGGTSASGHVQGVCGEMKGGKNRKRDCSTSQTYSCHVAFSYNYFDNKRKI